MRLPMDVTNPIIDVYIGIDTGRNTGIAIWSKSQKCFLKLETVKIHKALLYVLEYHNSKRFNLIRVRVEDARKRSGDKARAFGAGSVCRDASMWEDFLVDYAIPFELVAPQSNMTKVDEKRFMQMTGLYVKSDHSRDAAMLVFNF